MINGIHGYSVIPELLKSCCARLSMKIRNAVAAIFYIENSSIAEMTKNWNELVTLLKCVLRKDGIEIIRAIMDRIYQIHDLPSNSKTINKINDLTEVKSMLEANTKKWEDAVLERGIEKGIDMGVEKVVKKMISNTVSTADIRKMTGLTVSKINAIRKKLMK
jgi:predicted transposase/invertase (TIGR01784 family)